MTNKEIISGLRGLIGKYNLTDEEWQTIEKTIKVLNNSDEDCISRAELLKAIDTWDKFGVDDTNSLFRLDNLSLPHYVPYIHYDDVVKAIKGMPSIQTKTDVLDKIRAEIEQEYNRLSATRADETLEVGECLGLKMALKIVGKYKAEKE